MHLKIIILTCVMVIALTGCLNKSIENHPRRPVGEGEYKTIEIIAGLTLEDVKKSLEAEGLELQPVEVPDDWILNGVKPNRFTVGSPLEKTANPEQVSIYIFESENARQVGLADFNNQKEKYDMVLPRMYEVKNVMIFYWARAQMDKPAKYDLLFEKATAKL